MIKDINVIRKTERIAIRLTPKTRKSIDEIAKKENRSLSNWCQNAISEKILRYEEIKKKNKEF